MDAVSAAKDGKANTMTASWGGIGVLWGKNVATVYIRPQRHTKEFVDAGDTFTISFFGGGAHERAGATSAKSPAKMSRTRSNSPVCI